jgi:hypothetical protein
MAPWSPLVWGPVIWEAKTLAHPVQSSDHYKWRWDVDSEEDLNSIIGEAASTFRQQPGIFERTHVFSASLSSVYRGHWPYVCTSALNWYEIQFIFKILQWFCLISNLSQTQFDGP